MSTERDVTRIVRSWLNSDEQESADRVLDAVLAQLDTTPQRRATWWPTRRLTMNTTIRFGVAAAVLAVAAALGFGLIPNVGLDPTPSPSPSADASVASPPPAGQALPEELQHVFIGPVRQIEGLPTENADRFIMDMTLSSFRIQMGASGTLLGSAPTVTQAGEIRLELAQSAGVCQRGDVGLYPYSFSPGGTILTVEAGIDECATRAEAVPGTWQRSDCWTPELACLGVLESASYSSLLFEPYRNPGDPYRPRYGALTYAGSVGWANSEDRSHFYVLMPESEHRGYEGSNCTDCPDAVWLLAYPRAMAEDCSETPIPEVGTSADALAGWLSDHPGLVTTEQPAMVVDGHEARVLDLEMADGWTTTCGDGTDAITAVPLFIYQDPGADLSWAMPAGDRVRVILLDLDDTHTLAIVIDVREPDQLESFAAAEAIPLIETFRFTEP